MSFLRAFFHFTKKQRNGVFVLLFFILTLQCALYFDEYFYQEGEVSIETYQAYQEFLRQDSLARFKASILPPAFVFNPNEVGDSALRLLGLTYRLRSTVLNYLSKGGRFKRKEDVLKIYGMDTAWYKHVEDFIRLPDAPGHKKETYTAQKQKRFSVFDPNQVEPEQAAEVGLYAWQVKRLKSYRDKVRPFEEPEQLYAVYGFDSSMVRQLLPYVSIDTSALVRPTKVEEANILVDLATADSAMLTRVKGIGGWTAKRIVAYRERLGGFVDKAQLLEVYGMQEERFQAFEQQLVLSSTEVVKLNLNTATFKELLRHPYLNYALVQNIVYFREHTRPFERLEELKQIELVDGVLFAKIAPYLKVGP
jgi:DNA uptake protein ComE-like DNA-binding protein